MRLSGDFETCSQGNLARMGAWKYARQPSTRILCFSWAVEDEEPDLWFPPDRPPLRLLKVIDAGCEIHAWNAQFEFNIWNAVGGLYGLPPLPIERFFCTMARALYWGVPPKLETAAVVVGTSVHKDKRGAALMREMMKPRDTTDGREIAWWHEDEPDRLINLGEYCRQDVRTERAVARCLRPMPTQERQLWLLDQWMNMRGLRVDNNAVYLMRRVVAAELKRLGDRLSVLTGGAVPSLTLTKKLLEWLKTDGVVIDSLSKNVLPLVLKEALTPRQREIIEVYQEGAKTSTAKLKAMEDYLHDDDRVRGLVQYGGALRTLRWAGRGPQIQNYPRPSKTIDANQAIADILEGKDAEWLELKYGRPMDVVSHCLRGCYVPATGHVFAVADFSAIEARVVAWLAGEQSALDIFHHGRDIYQETAWAIGSQNRLLGKVLVLACIAEGELVLTDYGLVPIERVTRAMRVWDGVEWVFHDGVIFQGEREVIAYDGLRATPDHRVWTEGRSDPIPFGIAASSLARLVRSGDERRAFQIVGSDGSDFRPNNKRTAYSLPLLSVWGREAGGLAQLENWQDVRLSLPISLVDETLPGTLAETTLSAHGVGAQPLPESGESPVGELRWTRDYVRLQFNPRSGEVDHDPPGRARRPQARNRPDGQRSRLQAGQSALDDTVSAERQPKTTKVYDILNAGLRQRFTVSGRLCSNCGFGMGWKRFRATAATHGVELNEEQSKTSVQRWRELNSCTRSFWYQIDDIARTVISEHIADRWVWAGARLSLRMGKDGSRFHNALIMRLPSDRSIIYRNATLDTVLDDDGVLLENVIRYDGLDYQKKWDRIRTWGGKIVENATQATARDLLADAMLRLDDGSADLDVTIHDELIAEPLLARADERLSQMKTAMSIAPDWARGLPLKAEGAVMMRYGKS